MTADMPQRHFIQLSYDGTRYHGWQLQANAPLTVQATLDGALALLLRRPVETTGQGRTDTGVHAPCFYAHLDGPLNMLPHQLAHKLNRLLPLDMAVARVVPVPVDAHARFSALSRTYQYHIHTAKDPFLNLYSHHLPIAVDVAAMNAATPRLLAQRDFACFQKAGAQSHTTLCHLMQAEWAQQGHRLTFTVRADRFLRNMVRAMVGTLLEVGLGKLTPAGLDAVLESGSRIMAGTSVDARGLHLVEVAYPESLGL